MRGRLLTEPEKIVCPECGSELSLLKDRRMIYGPQIPRRVV